MRVVLLLSVVLCVFLLGCSEEQLAKAENMAEIAEKGLKSGAVVTVGTPLAPVLLFLGGAVGILGSLLKKRRRSIMPEEKVVTVVPAAFMSSRKNRLTIVALVCAIGVAVAISQGWLAKDVGQTILYLVGITTGVNIYGIAKEDAAAKGNSK